MNRQYKPWHVKYVSPATRKRFKQYAIKHGLELAEVLDIASKKL